MKILVDEMYEGYDDKLKEKGFANVESVKKLINSGMKLTSDFSVLNYARDNNMILVTADVENIKGCIENNMPCVAVSKTIVLETIVQELKKLKNDC